MLLEIEQTPHDWPETTAPGGAKTRTKIRTHSLMLECMICGIGTKSGLIVQMQQCKRNCNKLYFLWKYIAIKGIMKCSC